jgi:hypothetical protein
MNPSNNLVSLSDQFVFRLNKLKCEIDLDKKNAERYSIVSLALLNNFIKAYLVSLRLGSIDSNGVVQKYIVPYPTEEILIDSFVKIGNPTKWKPHKIGHWTSRDEPAFHSPRILSNLTVNLNPTNLAAFQLALTDSWKIDVLRNIRNYFAHRSRDTEINAINFTSSKYSIGNIRAADMLNYYDSTIASFIIDDIHDYLKYFSKAIT